MKKGINTYVKTGLACGLVLVQMGTVTMAAGLDTALVGLCSTVSLAPEAEAEPAAETV